MMEFLYFPENKLEYIPAAISCVLFFIGAVATLYVFKAVSKRELERIKQLEEQLYNKKKEVDFSSEKNLSENMVNKA